jgi:hypothetical protein
MGVIGCFSSPGLSSVWNTGPADQYLQEQVSMIGSLVWLGPGPSAVVFVWL